MLREKLQEMIEVRDVQQHPKLLRDLCKEYPKSVVLIESSYPIGRYTCLVHALDFTEKPEYIAIAKHPLNVYAGPEFAHWLVDHGHLREVSKSKANSGDLAFYFDQNQFKHVAVLISQDRAVSKWGIGHLFEHDILGVPASYGSNLRFFERLPYAVAHRCFLLFAEENGLIVGRAAADRPIA